jgi:hypothetical protein
MNIKNYLPSFVWVYYVDCYDEKYAKEVKRGFVGKCKKWPIDF